MAGSPGGRRGALGGFMRRSALVLALALAACSSKGKPKCGDAGGQRCNGTVAETCQSTGAWKPDEDCEQTGLVCVTTGVGPATAACAVERCPLNTTRCNGDLVEACTNNAWVTQQDCTTSGTFCR